jgi:hypothetical protein
VADTIELIHVGGERKTVEVTGFTGTSLYIRWGNLAGIYELKIVHVHYLVGARMWKAASRYEALMLLRELKERQANKLKAMRYGS